MFPILPHLASECLNDIQKDNKFLWPLAQKKYLEDKFVNIVIQINGKKKSLIKVEKDIDEEKLLQIAEIVQSFYFYDVRKEVNNNKNKPYLIFNFNDGLSIKIFFIQLMDKGEEAWVKIKATYSNKKMKDKADEINKKVFGYEFLANINTSEVLNWKIKNLIKK